ncbi:MAG: hypothetical protein ACYSR1_04265, partial [Planctomycetota bacterium]
MRRHCESRPYNRRGKAAGRRESTDTRTVFAHRGAGGCTLRQSHVPGREASCDAHWPWATASYKGNRS